MLFGDAHIEKAFRIFFGEFRKPGAIRHGRCDSDQALVLVRHVDQPVAEHLRIGLVLGRSQRIAVAGVKLAHAVILARIVFRRLVTAAFLGRNMQKLRARQFPDIAKCGHQGIQIVPIDGTNIVEAEFLEQRARSDHALDMLLGTFGELQHGGYHTQHFFTGPTHGGIEAPGKQLGQVVVERADIGRNGHVVVVENDQQVGIHRACIVQRFECHAGCHGAIADDGHCPAIEACLLCGHGHTQRCRDGSAGMAGAKGVVFALCPSRETGNAAGLAQAFHGLASTRQNLVRVGLVAHIPYQAVIRRIEDIMQGDGEFDHTKIGRQVAAGLRDAINQKGAQLFCQLWQLLAVE